MKKIFLIASLITVTAGVAAPGIQLARVERDTIIARESKVASDLAQDTFKKRLVFTAGLAAAGYLGYKYFNPTPEAISAQPASSDQILLNNELLQINNELLRQSLPDLQKVGASSWIQDSVLGKFGSWIWEFGKWTTQQAMIGYVANVLLLGSSSALGKMVKTVDNAVDSLSFNLFHDRDLKWFLISRSRVTHIFNELETHAYCLQMGTVHPGFDVAEQEQLSAGAVTGQGVQVVESLTLDQASYAYHAVAFEQTWAQLVDRVASLAAFIEHKAHATEQDGIQQRLLLGAQHIVELTNATAQQCENMLINARIDALASDILFEVRRLRASISEELVLANKLEHEISW